MDLDDFSSDSDFSLHLSESDSDSDSDDVRPTVASPSGDRWVTGDNVRASPRQQFSGPSPGPTVHVSANFTELDFFKLFFSFEVVAMLVEQTNRYADRQQEMNGHDKNWESVTTEEILAWLGIRVLMSFLQLPSVDSYWSEDPLTGGLRMALVMTRDRFKKISQYLHASDDTDQIPRGQNGHDKLHKVRQMLEIVRRNCLASYNPHQNTSIDEAMVAFRGRLSFRQYLPMKPTKYGIKVWMRADPENGYVNDFQVYTGKEERTREVGLGTRVVLDLMKGFEHRNHIVNVDNFFMSPNLCEDLQKLGTYARGTVRPNRKGFPHATLQKKKLTKQGDMTFAQKGHLTAVSWKDKKVVNLLSTADDPASIKDTVGRKSRGGAVIPVTCPNVVKEYNDNMNGVDRADQLRSELSTYRTSKKWWHYLFFFLFDISICNAFVMMRESTSHQQKTKNNRDKPRTMLQFRHALAKELIGQFQGVRKRKRTSQIDEEGNGHWPVPSKTRGRCRHCYGQGRRRDTRMKCCGCGVFLCLDCFKLYHGA